MPQYLVKWEMDIEANTYREAAEEARRHQLKEDSEAVMFTVIHKQSGNNLDIDLMEEHGG